MKIAKVNHTKTAVLARRETTEGILYRDPKLRDSEQEKLDDYLWKRIAQVKKLYEIIPNPKELKFEDKKVTFVARQIAEKLKEEENLFVDRQGKKIIDFLNGSLHNRFEDLKKKYDEDEIKKDKEKNQKKQNYNNNGSRGQQERGISDKDLISLIREAIEVLIPFKMKKSLRDSRYYDCFKVLLFSMYLRDGALLREMENQTVSIIAKDSPNGQKEVLASCQLDDLGRMFTLLSKDYNKGGRKAQLMAAIKNQNMPVQPDKETGRLKLPDNKKGLPDGDKGKQTKRIGKQREKDAWNEIFLEYASLDEEKGKEVRNRFRNIILLYFYGEESIMPIGEFDAWENHEACKNREESFLTDLSGNESLKPHMRVNGQKDFEILEKLKADYEKESGEKEKAKLYAALKKIYFSAKDDFRAENIFRYRRSYSYLEEKEYEGYFFERFDWNVAVLHFMENSLEKLAEGIKYTQTYKFRCGYLSEKVWKDIIHYLSTRYIALGKAVWHFALKGALDKCGEWEELVDFSALEKSWEDGINSFAYEQIKAEETFQRNVAVYIVFAVNNLSGATIRRLPKKEDLLLVKDTELKFLLKENPLKNILQYFGGKSKWQDAGEGGNALFPFGDKEKERECGLSMLIDMKKMLYEIRNETFHFDTMVHGSESAAGVSWDDERMGSMFRHEVASFSRIQKDKFYSNNLHLFFSETDLRSVLDRLYQSITERSTQIPAFPNVFVRVNFPKVLEEEFGMRSSLSGDDLVKWQSAVYYLFKEIYYNDFISSKDVKRDFFAFIENDKYYVPYVKAKNEYLRRNEEFQRFKKDMDNGKEQDHLKYKELSKEVGIARKKISKLKTKESMPFIDFAERVIPYKEKYTFSEICQFIMTEQNQQNNQSRKVKTAEMEKDHPDIYKHYKMILYALIRKCFIKYLAEAVAEDGKTRQYEFLWKQSDTGMKEQIEKDSFLPDWEAKGYMQLLDGLSKDIQMQKWYVFGRLLPAKQLNHLTGAIKQYREYLWDVERRAGENECRILFDTEKKRGFYQKVLQVLDLCRKLSETISTHIEDYFDGQSEEALDEYAHYLGHFVDYHSELRNKKLVVDSGNQREVTDSEGNRVQYSYRAELMNFCDTRFRLDTETSQKKEKDSRTTSLADAGKLWFESEMKEEGTKKDTPKENTEKAIGIYYDGENPILNRNIILSKMFGFEEILRRLYGDSENGIKKITKEDIVSYYKKQRELQKQEKTFDAEARQRNVIQYQRKKRQIEFHELIEYTEIMYELYGQLVNWCFLRERDLMYFQLGFHYMILQNQGQELPVGYDELNYGDRTNQKKGAILYQIAAMYTFGLQLYDVGKMQDGYVPKFKKDSFGLETGSKIPKFLKNYGKDGERLYLAGMELFENVSEHDAITELRNEIAHFHYFTTFQQEDVKKFVNQYADREFLVDFLKDSLLKQKREKLCDFYEKLVSRFEQNLPWQDDVSKAKWEELSAFFDALVRKRKQGETFTKNERKKMPSGMEEMLYLLTDSEKIGYLETDMGSMGEWEQDEGILEDISNRMMDNEQSEALEHGIMPFLREQVEEIMVRSLNKHKSFLDLYSEMFDRFFSYDDRYRKNVGNQLYNILMRHKIILPIRFTSDEEVRYKRMDSGAEKPCASLTLKDVELKSDRYTYKIEGKDQPMVADAKSRGFLQNVKKILEFSLD